MASNPLQTSALSGSVLWTSFSCAASPNAMPEANVYSETSKMTRPEELYSAYVWFKNLFMPTLKGRPACKPTMPMVIPIIRSELAQVIGPISSATDFTFVDLGCGQGIMLRPMSEAIIDGKSMFERCVGVELDPSTAAEAVATVEDDPKCKVECGDMFGFVDRVCASKRLFGGRAAFYIYEPLWMANLPEAEMDRLYAGLAAQVAKHPGSVIVYCTADSSRELKASVLEASGLVLQRSAPVAQNGVFNRLRGKFNMLEVWQAPHRLDGDSPGAGG